MQYMNQNLGKAMKFSHFLLLILIAACSPDSKERETEKNSSTKVLSINSFNCQSDPISNNCRDIATLSVNYNASDNGDLDKITGTITSADLGMSQNMLLVDGNMQVALLRFSGATDVVITLTAEYGDSSEITATENIGEITINSAPTCTSPSLIQNFALNDNDGSIELIDIATCSDPESDQIALSNHLLNTSEFGDYSKTLNITDEFGLTTPYVITGNIERPNLTLSEFTNQIIEDPSSVGASVCFAPINQIFDETVVCDFIDEWHGFQYGSTQDTSLFSNIAPIDSAQGFTNFPVGKSLNEIVADFSAPYLPDNQVVTNPGNSTLAITATVERDPNGNYRNSNISGGFNLQGSATENTHIYCDNQTYLLPVSTISNTRSSHHTIDQTFIESIAIGNITQRISNCVATNNSGLNTLLEGEIEIVVTDLTNQNPVIVSVDGVTQGFEGIRTVVANVTDADDNLSTVKLRYRAAGSNNAWTESSLTQVNSTNNYTATLTFDYTSNLNESGTIEYQVIAQDSYGGQGMSTLTNTLFFANEITAQKIIKDEITLATNKFPTCFDCTFSNPATGSSVGPFDGLFSDQLSANHAYEYNGEQRSVANMAILENSVNGTSYDFHEIPLGSVSQIRADIQNN